MSEVLETFTYHTVPGTGEAEFLRASDTLNGWMTRQKGFQYRTVVRSDAGAYIDLIYWASEAGAEAASQAFMSAPQSQPLMALIDPESLARTRLPQIQAACARVPEPA